LSVEQVLEGRKPGISEAPQQLTLELFGQQQRMRGPTESAGNKPILTRPDPPPDRRNQICGLPALLLQNRRHRKIPEQWEGVFRLQHFDFFQKSCGSIADLPVKTDSEPQAKVEA
jgi:hypothetical protein